MTHQEAIVRTLVAILSQPSDVLSGFKRGQAFSFLLRDYTEFNSNGEKTWKKNQYSINHYKFSEKAYNLMEKGQGNLKNLHPEHIIPLKIIKKRLLESDKTFEKINKIMKQNEVVYITKDEQRYIDKNLKLRDRLPENGQTRLEVANIKIAEKTNKNTLMC